MSELILIFEGSDLESSILRSQLEEEKIGVIVKSDANAGRIAGFGAVGATGVYVMQDSLAKASEIVTAFKARHQ